MKKYLLLCLTSMLFSLVYPSYVNAQEKFKPKYLRENDKTFLQLTSQATDNGWLEFKKDKDTEGVDPDSFFNRFQKNLGLGEGYQFRPMKGKGETDFREIRHQRFELYYKNIRVEGVEYSLHSKHKRVETAHGRIVEGLTLNVDKPMPERRALEVALADQKLSVDALKNKELPKGELLIARIGEEPVSQNFKLCYAFDVHTHELNVRKDVSAEPQRVYVDATTGQVVRRVPLRHKCFHIPARADKNLPTVAQADELEQLSKLKKAPLVASNFVPRWARYQQVSNVFETEPIGGQFRLSHQNGALLTRRDVNSTGNWTSNPDVLNNSTNWGTNAQNATTAHWLTQRVHQFYQQFAPDQNGYNRQGTYPRVLVDYNVTNDQVNAFWLNGQIAFGFGPTGLNNSAPDFDRTLVTADILGHEYTHAVTEHNANLEYQGESGALNESIADIFGTAYERHLFPNDWNWGLAEDSYQIRSMANPNQAFPPFEPLNGQPQVYLTDPRWHPVTDPFDRGGVHINSGVMNKWFHTLCTGQFPAGGSTPYKLDRYS